MTRSADMTLLYLAGLVFLVILVGFFALPQGTPSGRAVQGPDPCLSCEGTPVCAASGSTVDTYLSACEATCAGARVVYERSCKEIPRAVA